MIRPGDRVAVTGATGFIGRRLCSALLSSGYRVSALVRRPACADALAGQGADVVAGDLSPAPLLELTRQAAAVVHLAGAVRGAHQRDFDAVNVDGTAALLDVVSRLDRVPRFLLVSSLAAREPGLSWYAASKRAAEELLLARPDLDWVIVRPPAVYGPGDEEMLPVFRLMAKGLAPVPGSTAARLSLLHVDDLAAAIIACLHAGQSSHRVFSLHDGRPGGYDWSELAAVVSSLSGRRVYLLRLPPALLNGVARLNLRLARATGRAPMLTPAKLRELRHRDWVVDNEAITAATGWEPRLDLRAGLAELLACR